MNAHSTLKADRIAPHHERITKPTPDQRRAFADYRAALSVANAPTPALSIIQREIIDTAIKVRNANSVGLPTVARDKKIQLFALLRVRRAMREAAA